MSSGMLICVHIGALAMLGAVAGALGVFMQLREQTLLGDAIAHAALPGVALMFLITGTTSPFYLLAAGALTGLCGIVFSRILPLYTPIKPDAALGIVLSSFFGLGIACVSHVQKTSSAPVIALDRFLFGNAASLLIYDLIVIASVSAVVLAFLFMIYRPLVIMTFDSSFAQCVGVSRMILDVIFCVAAVATIVTGLQVAGVILTSALLLAPAVAARQLTYRMHYTIIYSMAIGVIGTIGGALMSMHVHHVPTGPAIIVSLSVIVGITMLKRMRS